MKIKKAVITCAGQSQRKLPLQTLIDRDGKEKSVLEILVEEVIRAGIENICLVVKPGDDKTYMEVAGNYSEYIHFAFQEESLGYGHALHCAADFVGKDAFLHLVGDHLYVSRSETGCAAHLVSVAEQEACSVSAVHAVRESIMPNYGVIGGQRKSGTTDLYTIDKVLEKPTPTEAEQKLQVPGLRAGHYLCFFGMHVLTSNIMKILKDQISQMNKNEKINLSGALNTLAGKEQYLGLEKHDWRYDVGTKYGLLKAQVALALSGKERDLVLSELLELFTSRELGSIGK